MERMTIKQFGGLVVGYIDIESNGDKTVKDFNLRILGYYDRSRDVTTDFYKRIIAYGDVTGIFFKDKIKF